MNIEKLNKEWLWVENEDGTSKVAVNCRDGSAPPVGTHPYAYSRFPNTLITNAYLRRETDGNYGSKHSIASGGSTFNEKLTLALAIGQNNQPKYRLYDAIIIAACACERCLNALLFQYGCGDGYPEDSDEYRNSRTRCDMCK